MKNNPNIINKVTISYYRSFDKVILKEIKPINIITGSNDVGKSNLLRALNLFFNEKDEFGQDFNFQKDFSKNRLLTVQKESVKGKQFIRMDVEFNCKNAFPSTLPNKFTVTKRWTRDSVKPVMSHSLQRQIDTGKLQTTIAKAEGSLSKFLNQIEFHYIPAIKDDQLFRNLIGDLQKVLSEQARKGSSLAKDMEQFNSELQTQARELRTAFHEATGVETSIGLPIEDIDLFKAFEVRTLTNSGEKIGLNQRGDGIRVRFIPEILNYISEQSNKTHIWGFEEPENSMEYRKAFELANKMANEYSKNSQIFVTTHSPAFFKFDSTRKNILLARQEAGITSFRVLDKIEESAIENGSYDLMLADELGHVALMHELNEKLNTRISEFEKKSEDYQVLQDQLASFQQPILLTEGITDKIILKQAWERVRKGVPCPFKIEECDTVASKEITAGGAEKLSICLKAVRPQNPHLVIGLFDYDKEGIKRFKLDSNFIPNDLFEQCKFAVNGKAVAICLQGDTIEHQKFCEFENLCIEFLFPRSALERERGGKRLTLNPRPVITMVGGKQISKTFEDDLWHTDIGGNKMHFAEIVVPTLPDSDFVHFDCLFKRIEAIIGSI